MKTYLSIDLDFWNRRPLSECEKILTKVQSIADRKGIKIKIVEEHHDLIDDINKTNCQRVINIDYHSDIANLNVPDGYKLELNCGTWANFLKGHENKEYIWVHPAGMRLCDGYCHYPVTNRYNPFLHPEIAKWKSCTRIAATQRDFPWDLLYGVDGIGFCTSYDYLRDVDCQLARAAKVFGLSVIERLIRDLSTYNNSGIIKSVRSHLKCMGVKIPEKAA